MRRERWDNKEEVRKWEENIWKRWRKGKKNCQFPRRHLLREARRTEVARRDGGGGAQCRGHGSLRQEQKQQRSF